MYLDPPRQREGGGREGRRGRRGGGEGGREGDVYMYIHVQCVSVQCTIDMYMYILYIPQFLGSSFE